MEVIQEPENEGGDKKGGDVNLSSNPNNTSSGNQHTNIKPASIPREPVKEIKVKVDLNQKPAELNEPVTLQSDDDFFGDKTAKTEGDIKEEEKQKEKADAFKNNTQTNSSIPSASSSSAKKTTPEKRKAQAEKWVAAIDMLRIWGLKQWSGQQDNVGLIVSDPDKEALADALADVMEEYDFNPAPLLTLGITSVGVFGGSFIQASNSRRVIKELRKTEAYKKAKAEELAKKEKPPLDPMTGNHRKKRGGQEKS